MSDRDIPNSVEECRAILKRFHQARDQSLKLQGHRNQLDEKIAELANQIDADRKLFLEERLGELGKLLSAKQALMLKLKQTKLEVDHWLDAVEEMEERSSMVTERLVDLLFKDDPRAEQDYASLKSRQSDAEQAVLQLAALQRSVAKAVDNLRAAADIGATALLNGILRFLYFWRTPTRMISFHLDQANLAALEIAESNISEHWLPAACSSELKKIARAVLEQSQIRWGFRTIKEVYMPLCTELEQLSVPIAEAITKAEQAAKSTHEQLQTWLLGED